MTSLDPNTTYPEVNMAEETHETSSSSEDSDYCYGLSMNFKPYSFEPMLSQSQRCDDADLDLSDSEVDGPESADEQRTSTVAEIAHAPDAAGPPNQQLAWFVLRLITQCHGLN